MSQRKPRVVVDANIIISALVFGGNPAHVITMGGINAIEIYVSEHILQESTAVLQRKFAWSSEQVQRAREVIKKAATTIKPTERIFIARDESDNAILECAAAAHADYLVSGDDDLLTLKKYEKIKIVAPAQFVTIMRRRV